jgi:hypothetical protein
VRTPLPVLPLVCVAHGTSGAVALLLAALLLLGLIAFLPQHLRFIGRRAVYYFYGREADPVALVLGDIATKSAGSVFESAAGEL